MPLLRLCKSTICPICEDGKISNEFSTNSKSMTRFSCKSNYMKMIKRERLSGGADTDNIKEDIAESAMKHTAESTPEVPMEPSVETVVEPFTESSVKFPTKKSDVVNKQIDHTSGPCCLCYTYLTGATGDDKVNEIIDCAHQNLQDAGKTLATLGENFEHGLKLAIADVLGRIQQWSITVQNKLDACKGDIENLRKELLSRICEINDKEHEITDLNAQIADLLSQINQLKEQIAECAAAKANCEKLLAEKVELLEQKPVESPVFEKIPTTEIEPIVTKPIVEPPKIKVVDKIIDEPIINNPIINNPIEKPKKIEEPKKPVEQTREKDRERKRRESELEAEIARLRKENEKIIKEKIDYENAIQRALLRGVSSLNVEALRVLRCPPIPCCSPCVPCPMSLGMAIEQTVPCPVKTNYREQTVPCPVKTNYREQTVPCPVKTKRTTTARAINKVCAHGNGNGKNSKHDQCDFTIKQPCASPCCPAEKSRRVSDNSMFFLLHEGDADNVCGTNEVPSPRPCGSPIMKTIKIPPCSRFSRP